MYRKKSWGERLKKSKTRPPPGLRGATGGGLTLTLGRWEEQCYTVWQLWLGCRNQYPFSFQPIFLSSHVKAQDKKIYSASANTTFPLRSEDKYELNRLWCMHWDDTVLPFLQQMNVCDISCICLYLILKSSKEACRYEQALTLTVTHDAHQRSIHSSTLWAWLCSAREGRQWWGFIKWMRSEK